MERDPIKNDARTARRTRRLGPDAACALCGVTTPEALSRVNRTLLEAHHVVCRAHDNDLTLPVCRNCHAVLTEGQLRAGVVFGEQASFPERLAMLLLALGAFFHDLGARLLELAEQQLALVAALDGHAPAWRQLVEAR